jgi:flagellar biosynthesis/type III secretory pathway chaperone
LESLLRDLRTLLFRQVENLRTLETVIREQQSALVRRDISAILESIQRQESCLEQVHGLEEDRARLMEEISTTLGLAPGSITLRRLTENLDPAVGDELRSTGETARETLENVGRVNRDNQMLIRHSLEFVHEMLGALARDGSDKQTYEPSGNLRERAQGQVLVDRTT